MSRVKIKTKTISSANILKVSAGTNCPQGGDAGHGGRTYLKLKNEAGTSLEIKVNGQEFDLANDGEFEIILAGDTECETFIKALKFTVATLESQVNGEEEEITTEEIDIN